jgi:hypothetical protein
MRDVRNAAVAMVAGERMPQPRRDVGSVTL